MAWNSIYKASCRGREGPLCTLASWAAVVAMAAYFLFYALTPWGYSLGPAILLLIALPALLFRPVYFIRNLDRESALLVATLVGYFLIQVLILTIHREDISEYDLSLRYLAAAIVLIVLLVVPLPVRAFFLLVGLSGVLMGVFTLYQLDVGRASRLQSFDNPIHYGNGALALCCLSFAGIPWARRQPYRWAWITLFILGSVGTLTASFLSGTRSGWVAVPLLIALALYVYYDRIRARRGLLPLILLFLASLISTASTVDLVRERSSDAVEQVEAYFQQGASFSSVGLRFDMYKAGLSAFKESPVFGVGPGGTDDKINEMINSGEVHPSIARFRHLHNQYIDNMARYGLAGLIAYLTLLLVPLALFLKKARHGAPTVRALGLAGALFTALHLVVNATQSMLERNIGVMMFLFVIVFVWVILKQSETADSSLS